MSRRKLLFSLFVFTVLLSSAIFQGPTFAEAPGAACDITNEIVDPELFVWTDAGDHYVGVLEYGEATFNINGKTLTTRAYRQEGGCFSIPGPTLHMAPGEKYVLRFRNL